MAEAERGGRRRTILRLLPLLVLVVAGGALVASAGGPEQMLRDFTSERGQIDVAVARLGLIAVLAYVAAYALLMTLVWVPAWLCTLIGGFLFGALVGTLSALIGATAGAVLVFLLARHGFGGMTTGAHPMVARLEAGFRGGAFSYTLFLRLVPVVPFSIVNIVPAILGVALRPYAFATFIGIIPSTIIYAYLGSGLRSLAGADAPLDLGVLRRPDIAWPLVGLAILALVPVVLRAWQRRRRAVL